MKEIVTTDTKWKVTRKIVQTSKRKEVDNSTKLVSEYDKISFNKWMNELITRNGTTNY